MDKAELPYRQYQGIINIAGKELACAVLSDGTRVLTAKAVFDAFERPRRGKSVGDQRAANVPSFIDANNLKPFTDKAFGCGPESSTEVYFTSKNGTKVFTGYKAEILPLLCNVYLQARDAEVLTDSQKPQAYIADILMRSLAVVGITALIDEATGYQYDRDQDELQKILSAYISKEFLPWAKRFPNEFYAEICRLKGWEYHGNQRPAIIGKITNEIVYDQLPEGVLEELRSKTPKSNSGGNRTKRFHQSLTLETGVPHLDRHITSLIVLMKACDTWEEFDRLFKKSFGLNYQTNINEFLPQE